MTASTAATAVTSAADMSAKMTSVRRGKQCQVIDVALETVGTPAAIAPKRLRLRLPSLTTARNARRAYAIAALLNGGNKSLEVEQLASREAGGTAQARRQTY